MRAFSLLEHAKPPQWGALNLGTRLNPEIQSHKTTTLYQTFFPQRITQARKNDSKQEVNKHNLIQSE